MNTIYETKGAIDWTEYRTKAIEICKRRNIEYIVKYALTKFL